MEDQPRREEVIEEEESPQPQLRRSMRHHKANHRYANATLTKDQVANILTKVLNTAKFQKATWYVDPGRIEKESVLRGSVKNQAPPLSLSLSRIFSRAF
jgi:hypothetical protein